MKLALIGMRSSEQVLALGGVCSAARMVMKVAVRLPRRVPSGPEVERDRRVVHLARNRAVQTACARQRNCIEAGLEANRLWQDSKGIIDFGA